ASSIKITITFGAPSGGDIGRIGGYFVSGSFPSKVVRLFGGMSGIGSTLRRALSCNSPPPFAALLGCLVLFLLLAIVFLLVLFLPFLIGTANPFLDSRGRSIYCRAIATMKSASAPLLWSSSFAAAS